MSELAIIIPCFNERGRLPRFLEELRRECPSVRIVIVEDGSSEPVPVEESELVHVLAYSPNRGKGYAVRYGWDWVLARHPETAMLAFCDADGAVPPREINRLLQLFRDKDVDAMAGSRICMLGKRVRRQPMRHYMGRVYATVISLMLDLPAYDTQCGCKFIRSGVYRQLASSLTVNGFAFDVEWMARLHHGGFSLREEPVDWEEIEGSKVHPLRDGWKMLRAASRIRKALHGS